MERKIHKVCKYIYEEYETIKHPTIFTILVLLACSISFQTLRNQIGIVARVILFVLAYIGAQNIADVIRALKKQYSHPLGKIILLIICVLATFCETGSYCLEPIYDYDIPVIPYFLLSFLWMSVIVLFLVSKLNGVLENSQFDAGSDFSIKAKVLMIFASLTLCMLCNYAFNPAITSHDSQYCYSEAFHLGEHPIDDGHPVFYIILLKLCTFFTPKIQFMIFVQAVYYAFVYTYTINTLSHIGIPKRICILIFVFVGIGFNTIIQIATLWKDIPFTISLIWLTILLVRMCINQQECSNNIWWYVQYAIASVLTALVRHNGLLPVIMTFIFSAILFSNKKRIIAAVLLSTITIVLIRGPLYSHYQVNDVPGLKFYAMANDIMYLYHQGGKDELIMQVVNDVTDWNPQNFNYTPYYTAVTRKNMNHYSVTEFINIYLHAWRKHPKTMLLGFLKRNTVAWSIDICKYERARYVNYLGEVHNDEYFLEHYPPRVENYFTKKLTILFAILRANHFVYMLYWRTAIYNLLMIVATLLIFSKYKKKFMLPALPFLPILLNVFVLLMTSGWSDYRYYWPSMLIASILLPYSIVIMGKGKKDLINGELSS